MNELEKLISPQCCIENFSEKTISHEGTTTTTKKGERKIFYGDAALAVADAEAHAIERESVAKSEGIKEIAKGAAKGAAIGVGASIFYAFASSLNTPTTSASREAIPTDAKVPGNDDIPGNVGGTA